MKKALYIILPIAVLVVVLMFLLAPAKHNWNIGAGPTSQGGQPYDMDLFDELMRRSLPNGYETEMTRAIVETGHDEDWNYYENKLYADLIDEASTDTSLLAVQWYDWVDNPAEQLISFAEKGGQALWVITSYRFKQAFTDFYNKKTAKSLSPAGYNSYGESLYYYEGPAMQPVDSVNDSYYSENPTYSAEWFAERTSKPIEVNMGEGGKATLDSRFAINALGYYDGKYPGPVDYVITPLIYRADNENLIYAVDLYFPESGGHLYITTLGMYFCNLGITIPGADQVRELLIGAIDDRPVKRIDYYRETIYSSDDSSGESMIGDTVLDEMRENPGTSLALTLLLAMCVLLVVRGAMRRHPADASYVPDDGLKSPSHDRLKKLRKSPLLMRLYQLSWLYGDNAPFDDLFIGNINRMARMLKRYAGIELKNATDADIARAAKVIADRQNMDVARVVDDITWMRDSAVAVFENPVGVRISKAQFKYSQYIVERYPRVGISGANI